MSSTVLPSLVKMPYGVPRPIRALLFLREARLALQRSDNAAAVCATEEGKSALKPLGSLLPAALDAALSASMAIAYHRQDSEAARAHEQFNLAAAAFVDLLAKSPASVAPFLRDYVTMLNEFAAFERFLGLAETLKVLSRNGSATWISPTSISPAPNLIMTLANSLRDEGLHETAAEVFLHASGLALAGGDQPLALTAAQSALDAQPGNPQAYRMRGLLQWLAGLRAEALLDLEQAAQADLEDVDAQSALAHVQLTAGELQTAFATTEKVRAVDAENPDALLLQGEIHRLLGEAADDQRQHSEACNHWQTAAELLVQALRSFPDPRHALLTYAIVLYHLGDFQGAFQELTRTLERDPGNVCGSGWHADVLMKLGRPAEALEAADIALTLLNESREKDTALIAWLLSIKGRALMATGWIREAIAAFEEAVRLQAENNRFSTELLNASKANGDWQEVVRCAHRLQSNPYDEQYLLFLRTEEINAYRSLGHYEDAFAALKRIPHSFAQSANLIWAEARLLADVGNFEDAEEVLRKEDTGTKPHAGHLSLQGWAVQNLEPGNAAERKDLATRGSELYQTALNIVCERENDKENTDTALENRRPEGKVRPRTDVLWPMKGLANAKLRLGETTEAFTLYREVIRHCEQEMPSANEDARVLALTGWCYHCMGEPKVAARYYGAAIGKGENAAAVLFDHGLVLAALPSHQRCLEAYGQAAAKAQEQGGLRRIGLCRVALHDLRETLFRGGVANPQGRIAHLLCLELLDAADKVTVQERKLVERILDFVDIAIKPPVEMDSDWLRSIQFGIKAARAKLRGDAKTALEAKHEVAHLYSQIDEPRWAAKAWRELYELNHADGQLAMAFEAARNALRENLYGYDLEQASTLIAFVTHCVSEKLQPREEYEQLLRETYLLIGPERAFLDANELIRQMPSPDRDLFLTSVLRLFPPIHWDERWLYLRLDEQMLRVPNSDAVQAPFNRFREIGTFKDAQQAVLESVV